MASAVPLGAQLAWMAPDSRPGGQAVSVARVEGAACDILLDGHGAEPCWADAVPQTVGHVFRPVPGGWPAVETRFRVMQDAQHLYVWVEADDPDTSRLRHGNSRRDKVANDQDNVSLYIDPVGSRRFAQMFRVNPSGSLTDGTWNEANMALSLDPDFEFDAATAVSAAGWSAEFRIPFRSLRYAAREGAPAPWTVLVTRSHPRADRHVYASAPISPNSDCFLCQNAVLERLDPPASPRFWQAMPYLAARSVTRHGADGRHARDHLDAGLDVKARLGAATFIDATVNPDFSQVDLDTPQLSANARFGLFYREKRPFFLEGADLFDAPLPLQTTRTIGEPAYGVRLTHRSEEMDALAILARDRGGAAIMYPGPFQSYPIVRDSEADVALVRTRWSVGPKVAVKGLASLRQFDDGERNAVLGADLAWQASPSSRYRFQWAVSETRRDARHLAERTSGPPPGAGQAALAEHSYYGSRWESLLTLERIGSAFRSENGFLGQVGHGRAQAIVGYRLGPQGWFSEVKPCLTWELNEALPGGLVYRQLRPAIQLLGPSTSVFVQAQLDDARADRDRPSHRLPQWMGSVRWTPGPGLTLLQVDVEAGRRLDYASDQVGPGVRLHGEIGYRLARHVDIGLVSNHERIDRADGGAMLSDTNHQLLGTHSLGGDRWVRLILQTFRTERSVPSSDHRVSERHVGSLVWAVAPWPGSQLSVGLSAVLGHDASSRHHRTQEAFLKWQHAFAGGF
ncbi:DUF5916 domain-containing protein [Ideonella sp.]|uniref:DUF5916 domain-containing protein n=1 Tax=Ideonella sp. TaxID=1929293 RepID=UPI0035B2C0E3